MELIDLTYELHEGMTTFNTYWHSAFSLESLGRIVSEGRETRKVSMGTHTGTHIDAPLHFIDGGDSIDMIPMEKMVGKVSILDLSCRHSNLITSKDIPDEKISKRMLFKFGWGENWGTDNFYRDYPFFDGNAVKKLVKGGMELIAMDTPSPDDPKIKLEKEILGTKYDSPNHKTFLSNGVVLVEYVSNLDKLDDLYGWNIAVAPLKLRGADGSPARVFLFRI